MGKLKIECLQKRHNLKKLCKAVYTVLNQKDNLKVELVYKDGAEMQALNKSQRGVDKVTDVLSFPTLDGIRGKVIDKNDCTTEMDGKFVFLGSIVLCEDKIREQANELGHSYETERDYLIVHGLMHLMGYDHMTDEDKAEMREKEKSALKLLGRED